MCSAAPGGTTITGQADTPEDFEIQPVANGYQTVVMNQQPAFPLSPIVDVLGSLTIAGDGPTTDGDTLTVAGSSLADTFTINKSQIGVSGTTPFNYTAANFSSVNVQGLDGNDALVVDDSAGLVTTPINYDGGDGNDKLIIQGGAGAIATTYTVGPNAGDGAIIGVLSNASQSITFKNLEPVIDTDPGTLTINATGADNAISYTGSMLLGPITGGAGYANGTYLNVPLTGGAGSGATANIVVTGGAVTAVTLVNAGSGYAVGNSLSASAANLGGAGSGFSVSVTALTGKIAVDGFEVYEFANKTALTINAQGGDDTINLNNPGTPTGLTSITVDGGDPTASDKLIVNGTAGDDTISYMPDAVDPAAGTVVVNGVSSNFTGIESVIINALGGNDAITFNGTAASDAVVLTPTGNGGGTLQVNNSAPSRSQTSRTRPLAWARA